MSDSLPDGERRAYERGRAQALIESEVQGHEKRLNAINGSIERHAAQAAALRDSIEDLRDKIDAVAASIATKTAVEHSRTEQLKRANEQQISNRTFWLGVVAIVATILAAVIASHGAIFT